LKALLVYPWYPDTFWGYKHALRFVRAKAAYPPLGLLTVAAMLPEDWEKRLVDMNVETLTEAHLDWADLVMISGMVLQKESAEEVIARCREKGVRTVAGGPLFAHLYQEIEGVDHFVLGEAEEVLPEFLRDFGQGRAKAIYKPTRFPSLTQTPAPLWELIDARNYRSLSVQFSRGCPFNCEFCDVVALFGHRMRLKTPAQVTAEFDCLNRLGWRGSVMLVDDNFIGHKKKTKELLQEVIAWQRENNYPFNFITQASVNMADDKELLSLMAEANFNQVFLGIETPSAESLKECNKRQNQNRSLVNSVKTIQGHGMEVMGGFIVGFDADPPSIFEDQASFIEQAGIPTAMVGLLSVFPGTKLYERIKREGRFLGLPKGDGVMSLGGLNFVPRMDRDRLIAGYRSLLDRLYAPKPYYRRVMTYLKQRDSIKTRGGGSHRPFMIQDLTAAIRIFWRLGFREAGRRAFWAFVTRVGLTRPNRFALAINLAATGYHHRIVSQRFMKTLD